MHALRSLIVLLIAALLTAHGAHASTTTFTYQRYIEEDGGTVHLGSRAEDFYAVFGQGSDPRTRCLTVMRWRVTLPRVAAPRPSPAACDRPLRAR